MIRHIHKILFRVLNFVVFIGTYIVLCIFDKNARIIILIEKEFIKQKNM